MYRNRKGRFAKRRTATVGDKILVGGMILTTLCYVISDTYKVMSTPVVYQAEASTVVAEEVQEVKIKVHIDWTEERIKEEVWARAEKYNTYPEKMWAVMKCENPHLDPSLQSLIVKDGIREDSWGLAQFYLPAKNKTADGRTITKEIATDPVESIDAMAWHFSEGRARLWTCWHIVYG